MDSEKVVESVNSRFHLGQIMMKSWGYCKKQVEISSVLRKLNKTENMGKIIGTSR